MLVRLVRPLSFTAPIARNFDETHNIHIHCKSVTRVYPLQTIPAMINAAPQHEAARKQTKTR